MLKRMSIDKKKSENEPSSCNVASLLSTLSVQSKLILFTILLQNKSNDQARTVKAISTKEVYAIYIELCKKIQNTQLSYKRVNEIISELKTAGLISN